eukprot:TRINITY_DN2362_c1_g2_i1.p1 TRINITY_DN2362_c1_g2~~TRINITY_DN2362_c1_g2_i1.p1  ORF type:complete len:1499 (+),score=257.92 TRINITY_DN2362_c1_g2_i1:81-4577(+)
MNACCGVKHSDVGQGDFRPAAVQTPMLQTFLSVLNTVPDNPVFTFVDGKGRDTLHLSFRALHARAASFARRLGELGVKPQDRLILCYQFGADVIIALLGCFYAGAVAVPVIPPRSPRDTFDLKTLCSVCDATMVLSDAEYMRLSKLMTVKAKFQRDAIHWPPIPWHETSAWTSSRDSENLSLHHFHVHSSAPNDLAVIQFTSGSTGTPKGVMLTYANLEHQLANQQHDLFGSLQARSVIWAPHFHDMGLISCILSAMYGSCQLWLMSPLDFIRKPSLWMLTMNRVRATHTAAPNFAYGLVARKVTSDELAGMDLSSLQVVMSGGEPIRAETMRAFYDKFSPHGFRREAFSAAFGMAEHSVMVTAWGNRMRKFDRVALETHGIARPADESTGIVVELHSSGRVMSNVCALIVDPHTCQLLADGHVGELWCDSGSKGLGYWNDPETTRKTFYANLADGKSQSSFLRTGDQGFMLEGELYITGRLKDLIIVNGRNIAPQDIEATVCLHALVRPGCAAAFATRTSMDADEHVALMVELQDTLPRKLELNEVAEQLRGLVATQHHCSVATIVLGTRGLVAKTTSGKVRRSQCRSMLQDDSQLKIPSVLKVCVFTTDVDGESLMTGTELSQTQPTLPRKLELNEVAEQLRGLVATQHHCSVATIVLGTRGLVAKTTSGKVRRSQCRSMLQDDSQLKIPSVLKVCVFTTDVDGESLMTGTELSQTESNRVTDKKRVVVIGAGPSGLFAAYRLKQQGHIVTVLERDDHVGGKAASVEIGGYIYDVGGHACNDICVRIRELMSTFSIASTSCTPSYVLDVAACQVDHELSDTRGPWRDELLRYEQLIAPHLQAILEPCIARAAQDLSEPAIEWFNRHGLHLLSKWVACRFTGSGYGFLQDIPMAYAAKFISGLMATTQVWAPAGGYGSLWSKVAASIGDVRIQQKVLAVQSDAEGVSIQLDSGEVIAADVAIVAIPLPQASSLILPLSAEERALLSKAHTLAYWTVMIHCSGVPRVGLYLLREASDQHGNGEAVAVAYHHRYAETDIVTFYAFGRSKAAVEASVRCTVDQLGGTVHDVSYIQQWDYFPHFASHDLQAGAAAQLEALQGVHNVYYLGSALCFELVESNLAYVQHMLQRHFGLFFSAQSSLQSMSQVMQFIQHECAAIMQLARPPQPQQLFAELGLSADHRAALCGHLSVAYNMTLPASCLDDYSCPQLLAQHICEQRNRILQESVSVVQHVKRCVAEVMNTGVLPDAETAFLEMGMDSLRLAQLLEMAVTEQGVTLPDDVAYQCTTSQMLGERVAEQLILQKVSEGEPHARRHDSQQRITRCITQDLLPLAASRLEGEASPAQRRIFLHAQTLLASDDCKGLDVYWLPYRVDLQSESTNMVAACERVQEAVRILIERHSSLRTVFFVSDSGILMQRVTAPYKPAVDRLDDCAQQLAWAEAAADRMLDLFSMQPLFRFFVAPLDGSPGTGQCIRVGAIIHRYTDATRDRTVQTRCRSLG